MLYLVSIPGVNDSIRGGMAQTAQQGVKKSGLLSWEIVLPIDKLASLATLAG